MCYLTTGEGTAPCFLEPRTVPQYKIQLRWTLQVRVLQISISRKRFQAVVCSITLYVLFLFCFLWSVHFHYTKGYQRTDKENAYKKVTLYSILVQLSKFFIGKLKKITLMTFWVLFSYSTEKVKMVELKLFSSSVSIFLKTQLWLQRHNCPLSCFPQASGISQESH